MASVKENNTTKGGLTKAKSKGLFSAKSVLLQKKRHCKKYNFSGCWLVLERVFLLYFVYNLYGAIYNTTLVENIGLSNKIC